MAGLVRRHGSGMALVGVLAGLLALVLLLAPGAAGPQPVLAHYAGSGVTTTPDRQLAEGWYAVSWTARAADQPEQGCLFGMRMVERQSFASAGPKEQFIHPQPPPGNLVYQVVPRGSTLSGSSGAMILEPGIYGFEVDGWCAWDVSLARVDPPPLPSGVTYGGPRM
jgi:hypothetical protein